MQQMYMEATKILIFLLFHTLLMYINWQGNIETWLNMMADTFYKSE